jgi:hypothetical protein
MHLENVGFRAYPLIADMFPGVAICLDSAHGRGLRVGFHRDYSGVRRGQLRKFRLHRFGNGHDCHETYIVDICFGTLNGAEKLEGEIATILIALGGFTSPRGSKRDPGFLSTEVTEQLTVSF